MLDIFLIGDEETTPEYPDELQQLGGVEFEQHKRLEEVFEIFKVEGMQLPYFGDARLNSNQVRQMLNILNELYPRYKIKNELIRNDFEYLLSIIHEAVFKNSGIIAFCD